MDGTGSGSCPMAGFGITDVQPSGSAARLSVYGCETSQACSELECVVS
jgi:hypothetical protein